jgi:hypothetical protein
VNLNGGQAAGTRYPEDSFLMRLVSNLAHFYFNKEVDLDN